MSNKTLYSLIIIPTILLILYTVISAKALSGYSYKSDVDFVNNTSSDIYERLTFNINANALNGGGFCQSDFDDVVLTEDEGILELTIIGTNEINPIWLTDYGTIPANSTITRELYMGNSSGTKNQKWIGSDEDSIITTDHNDLDLETEFMLNATITLLANPATKSAIISKIATGGTTGYELTVDSGPVVKFTIFSLTGTPNTISESISLNTEYELSAWYHSGSLTLDVETSQSSIPYSGSISKNSEDIHTCEFDGYCDDIFIRGN